MVDLGARDNLIHLLCSALTDDKKQDALAMMDVHMEKFNQVTEQDMLKMLLVLTIPEN